MSEGEREEFFMQTVYPESEWVTVYKLVADKIPMHIKARGGEPQVIEFTIQERRLRQYKNKFFEELDELLMAQTKEERCEEAGDVLRAAEYWKPSFWPEIERLLLILLRCWGISREEVWASKQAKYERDGGFDMCAVLIRYRREAERRE